jgi:molybdopterin converting factor subunit 1
VRVTVLYFAVVRELVGREEERVELPASVKTAGQFADWLPTLRVELLGRMGSVRIARNEAFAANEEELADGDVLALIPPVAGG